MANVEGAIVMATMPVIPERRSRALMEVIDVDSLDDDELLRSERPSQRRRIAERQERRSPRVSTIEPITILDSDEEQDASTSLSPSRRGNRHRIFSPPPPPQDNFIPPVPSIPSRFAGQQSFPMRRLPPPFPSAQPVPDVMRAIERPLEFDVVANNEPVAPRRSTPQQTPFPAAAPPSHHAPSMGLGGALVSQHRRHGAEEHAARRRAARERALERMREQSLGQQMYNYYRTSLRHLAGGIRNASRTPGPWSQIDHDAILAHILASQDPPDAYVFPAPDEGRRAEQREPDYLPFYTHPARPLPEFTADFAPPSITPPPSNGSSSSQTIVIVDDSDSPVASTSTASSDDATPLLVCLQCLDPLTLINGKDDVQHRLWAMRCGHVIDGKCMEKLMKPPVVVADGQDNTADGHEWNTKVETGGDSIRTRLRSYHPGQPAHSQSSTFSSLLARRRDIFLDWWREEGEDPIDMLSTASTRRKGGKGKGKAIEPIVEATHEWACPVSGCGKAHTSLLIEGKWTMDKEKGAIGIYA